MTSAALAGDEREALLELAPALRRAVELDPACLVRLRIGAGRATALVRLPFDVLVSRGIVDASLTASRDVTVAAAGALAWLEDATIDPPPPRDDQWRSGLPPERGWVRLERVPDDVIRPLVRSGATALEQAAAREGVPGAQPRAEVADALLDSVVLTVSADDGPSAEVTLRALSALTRMGFLRRDGHAFVDRAGRWVRVVGEFGTVYLEGPGGLLLR